MENEVTQLRKTLQAVLADIEAHTAATDATSSFPVSPAKLKAAADAIKKAQELRDGPSDA
jgi:hypothetical protein